MAALLSGRRRQLARPAPHSSERPPALQRTGGEEPGAPGPPPHASQPAHPAAAPPPRCQPTPERRRPAPPGRPLHPSACSTVPRSGQGSAAAPPSLAREPPPWGSSQLSGKTDPAQVREWEGGVSISCRVLPTPLPPPAGPRGRQISCSSRRQKLTVTVHPLNRKSKLQEQYSGPPRVPEVYIRVRAICHPSQRANFS